MASTRATPLGRLLQERRQQAGYSRVRAGELADLRPSTIESWELGRVSKPPIHDVLRLARVLDIASADLERAVLPEQPPQQRPTALPTSAPLLDQATTLLGWSDDDAANALSTSLARIRALRCGTDHLSVLEVMTLTALVAAFDGTSSPEQVAQQLTRLRRAAPP